MGLKERLLSFIEYKKFSVQRFEHEVGLSNASVSKMGDNTRRSTIDRISNKFPELNPNWLITGVGEMLNNANPTPKYNEAVPIQQDVVYIPLVNQFAYAGYMEGYSDCTYLEQLPKVPFIVDHEGHGNYIAFEVKGDSMNNGTEESYLEGDRLYCREIQPLHLGYVQITSSQMGFCDRA